MIREFHPVLILTRNNISLTTRAIESVFLQTLRGVSCHVIDNGSSDGTVQAMRDLGILMKAYPDNHGVSAGWNVGLNFMFDQMEAEHVLVLNSDVVIPPWFYAALLSYDEGFVTGVAVEDPEAVKTISERMPLVPHPDFSAFLIRKEFWKKIGPFDCSMHLYASDQDFHIRGHRLGLGMWKANTPYLHVGSATLKMASAEDRESIRLRADADREALRSKWGVSAGGEDYQKLFSPEKFGIDAK